LKFKNLKLLKAFVACPLKGPSSFDYKPPTSGGPTTYEPTKNF